MKDVDKQQVESYVRQAQNGDTDAFAKLYDLYVETIYRYILFKVGKEEALDLTENVFLKVWENLKTYKTGNLYFSSWIFKIAHNLIVDHYRLSQDTAMPLDMDVADEKSQANPILLAEKGLSSELLSRAISKLKKNYQQVIILKYINDLENREIARIMKRGEGSLRILKFRALKALKQVLLQMGVKY